MRVRNNGSTWFYTYNHDVPQPYFATRDGFVRASIKFQGLVGLASRQRKHTTLTWLANINFGGFVPPAFVQDALINAMYFPRTQVMAMDTVARGGAFPTAATSGNSASAVPAKRGKEHDSESMTMKMPRNLTIKHCLIKRFKGKTIEEQREFFHERMAEMAVWGKDEKMGWKHKGKSRAMGVALEDQLDVYERTVPWSTVTQLRSAVETDFTCDQVFDHLLEGMRGSTSFERLAGDAESGLAAKALHGDTSTAFISIDQDIGTCILYKEIPFPWPFSSRYCFIVQEYIRKATGGFTCYNHDVDVDYFRKRDGFKRASVKFQGMVGEEVGDKTRITVSAVTAILMCVFPGSRQRTYKVIASGSSTATLAD